MIQPPCVLHLEDDPLDAELIRRHLQKQDFVCELVWACDKTEYVAHLERTPFDVILSDYHLPDCDFTFVLSQAQRKQPQALVIVVSGALGEEAAVDCLKLGATDYVLKDRLQRLVPAVKRALTEAETHRKRQAVEHALHESEQRFRQLAENSSEGFWFSAIDPIQILYISPACERIWRIPAEQVYQNPDQRFACIHHADLDHVKAAYENWITGKSPHYNEEYRIIQSDESVRWVADSGTLVVNESGVPARASGIIRDITDNRLGQMTLERTTKALRLANTLLEEERAGLTERIIERTKELQAINAELVITNRLQSAILNSAHVAILSVDKQGIIQTFNYGAEWLLGWQADEVIGERTLISMLDSGEMTARAEALSQQLGRPVTPGLELLVTQSGREQPERSRWTLIGCDGRRFPALMTVSPLSDELNEVVGLLCLILDITERLRAEQERDRFFNFALDLFCIVGRDGYFKRVNPSFKRMLGYSDDELFARPLLSFVHPDERQRTLEQLKVLQEGKPVIEFENRYCHADGTWRYLAWQAIPDDELIYASARDVTDNKLAIETERQHTRQRLLHQEALLRLRDHRAADIYLYYRSVTEECAQVLAVERISIWLFDKERKNLVCQALFDVSKNQHMRGSKLVVADHPSYFQALAEQDTLAADDVKTYPPMRELLDNYLNVQGITAKLDTTLYLSSSQVGVFCIEHAGDQRNWTRDEIKFATAVAGLVVLNLERIRRRRAELLAKLHSRATEILATTDSIANAYEQILQTLCQSLGWEVGNYWTEDARSNRLRCVRTWRQTRSKATKLVESSQQRYYSIGEGLPGRVWASGKPLWIADLQKESHFTRLPFTQLANVHAAIVFPTQLGSRVTGVLEFFSDRIQKPDARLMSTLAKIGEQIAQFYAREEAEIALRQHQVELSTANAELTNAKEAAEQASRAKSAFLATMSHEIRTPMNGVLGAMELLTHSVLTTDQQELLNTAYSSAQDLLRLLNDVLDMAKVEAGRLELVAEPCSLANLVNRIISIHGPTASSKALTLTSTIDNQVEEWVMLDQLRLTQVLGNLVGNAIKFTPQGSVLIDLSLVKRSAKLQTVRFQVIDTGKGIPHEVLVRLFQPFEQGTMTTARQAGGTGLGLAICKGIVERMGGRIWMESTLGQGSNAIVELTLSITQPPTPEPEPPPLSIDAANRTVTPSSLITVDEARRRGELVLIVDDHPTNRALLQRQLAMLGFAVEEAGNGIEALQKLAAGGYGLVLTDCQMPEMDGYELARTIRAQGMAELPIVAVTAHAFAEITERCTQAGMNDVIAKPIDLDVLAGVLAQWLTQHNEVDPSRVAQQPSQSAETTFSPLNLSRLVRLTGGDDALEREILADFNTENANNLMALKQAIDAADQATYARLAHRMKGAGKAVGAQALVTACEQFEAVARDQASEDEIMAAFNDIAHACQALEDYLATRLTV